MNMKSLKPTYFVVGMTGMFSIAVPTQIEWLDALPVMQSRALAVLLSLLLATLLAWLTQFRRRQAASLWLLRAFAACGLLVAGMPVIATPGLVTAPAEEITGAILRLMLLALFCLVALHTQPASDYAEGAP
jgi:hypothetical protein